jgi:hypothetical protein
MAVTAMLAASHWPMFERRSMPSTILSSIVLRWLLCSTSSARDVLEGDQGVVSDEMT